MTEIVALLQTQKPDGILHRPDVPAGLAEIFQRIAHLGMVHPSFEPVFIA